MRRIGVALVGASTLLVAACGLGSDDGGVRSGGAPGAEQDLAPLTGDQVQVIDEEADLSFTLGANDFRGPVDPQVGDIPRREYLRDDRTDRLRERVVLFDDGVVPDIGAAVTEAHPDGTVLVDGEPADIDGAPGSHLTLAPPRAADGEHLIDVWAAEIPAGGFILAEHSRPRGPGPGPDAAPLARSIRFAVGYDGGPKVIRAPQSEGSDPRPIPYRDEASGISWAMTEQVEPLDGGQNLAPHSAVYQAAAPEDPSLRFESVSLVPSRVAPTLEDALVGSTYAGDLSSRMTTGDITIAGIAGSGGTSVFGGSRLEPPRVEEVWAVPVAGGFVVLRTFVYSALSNQPHSPQALADTFTIPPGATIA